MTEEMVMVSICQEMGWTYYDYVNQPSWFIELLKEKMTMDTEKLKKEMNKAKHRLRT